MTSRAPSQSGSSSRSGTSAWAAPVGWRRRGLRVRGVSSGRGPPRGPRLLIHSVSTLVHCREGEREYGGAGEAGRADSLPPPAASSTATLQPHPPTRPHCDLRLSHTRVRMAGLQPHPPILQRHLFILQPHPSILRCIRLCYNHTYDVATKLPALQMTIMPTSLDLLPTPTAIAGYVACISVHLPILQS